jgi:ppGpp synthetase/RelA/SpoT-type nucleotidyltranferase
MTNGEINRLGDKIRAEYISDSLCEKTLNDLQTYRTSHKDSLAKVFNALCNINRKMGKQNIVTYRIKRFESIIGKLYRFPKMDFSRMWDIGGCRCIVNNNEEVYRLKELIEKSDILEIRAQNDHIETPKPDGYKSLHLYIYLKTDPNKVIELQIRNKEDHNWATLVEITDLLFDAKLKEYGKNKELLRFHFLLSKRFDLTTEEKKEIAKTIKKYKYFEKLSNVFSRNYIQIRKQWLNIESKNNHNYFLIETKKDQVPKITSYKKFDEAEENYFNIYKNNENANVVLTHLQKPNYEHISIAYSNYILTFHSFLDDSYEIFERLIEKTLVDKKYFEFVKYFTLYNEIVYNHVKNLMSEVLEVYQISKRNSSNTRNYKLKPKEKDWVEDINSQVRKRQDKQKRIQVSMRQNIPKGGTIGNYIFTFITKRIARKYNKRIKLVVEKMEIK